MRRLRHKKFCGTAIVERIEFGWRQAVDHPTGASLTGGCQMRLAGS
jgi:hypothetical protein